MRLAELGEELVPLAGGRLLTTHTLLAFVERFDGGVRSRQCLGKRGQVALQRPGGGAQSIEILAARPGVGLDLLQRALLFTQLLAQVRLPIAALLALDLQPVQLVAMSVDCGHRSQEIRPETAGALLGLENRPLDLGHQRLGALESRGRTLGGERRAVANRLVAGA